MRNALVGFVMLAPVAAQTVWNVTGANGIQAAINAASPGDILVLTHTTGSLFRDYEPFTLDKGLTIRGNGALIGTAMFSTVFTITIAVPPGQVAHLDRIVTMPSVLLGATGVGVVVQGGTVRFQDCELSNIGDALAVGNADVTFAGGSARSQGSVFVGPSLVYASGLGISAVQARLVLRDCIVAGATASQSAPRAGIAMTASVLQAERVQVGGGSNVIPSITAAGAPGITATSSTMWISDSTLSGGYSSTGAPGAALVNSGGPTAALCQTLLIPGTGGSPSVGPVDPNAQLLRLSLSAPWQRGAVSSLQVKGQPNWLYALWLAPDRAGTSLSLVVEPLWVVTGAPVVIGLLDSTGTDAIAVAVPNVASLEHQTVWCQVHGGAQLPLRASTIAGGVIR